MSAESARDERLAELLRRVLEEGLDPASEEALNMFEDDDIAGSLARSQAVIGLLDRSADAQRADLAAVPVDPRHEAQVRRFVHERVAPRRRPVLQLVGIVALAAAAVFALWILPWGGPDTPARPGSEVTLGADGDVRLEADGVHWTYELPTGGWFEVVVRDATGAAVDRSGELTQPWWPVGDAQRATWPADATIEVEVVDGTGRSGTLLRAK